MGSINTEEAARRLARVILSDIELYHRERPKQGETLEGQIEEGRRLFASRVTPDLLPVFGLVLSDRTSGRVNSPAVAEPPSTGASTAAAFGTDDAPAASNRTIQDPLTPAPSMAAPSLEDQPTPAPALAAPGASTAAFGTDDAPAASNPTIQDPPTPAPSIVAPSFEDQPTPGLVLAAPGPSTAAFGTDDVPAASNPTIQDPPTPAPSIVAPSLEDQPTPGPVLAAPIVAPSLEDQPTPGPVLAAPPVVDRPALTASVPPTPRAPETPAVRAQTRPAAPPAHEIPIPVLTARFSIPKLLAIVSAVAAAVAVLYHLFS